MTYRILCYGDSNTYGYIPAGMGRRYDEQTRWTALLQKKLGTDYTIIEEGCSGRTTDIDDPDAVWKNGMKGLHISLHSHRPLDMIILMLGTNDLKTTFRRDAKTIAASAASLGRESCRYLKEKQGYEPVILFLCPPALDPSVTKGPFGTDFTDVSVEVSEDLGRYYRKQASENGWVFMNTAEFLKSSGSDGLHWNPREHRMLAEKLAELIPEIRIQTVQK